MAGAQAADDTTTPRQRQRRLLLDRRLDLPVRRPGNSRRLHQATRKLLVEGHEVEAVGELEPAVELVLRNDLAERAGASAVGPFLVPRPRDAVEVPGPQVAA